MKDKTFRIPDNELIVDNFAGGGGASKGIEMALGRKVDIAINHDPEAIAVHKVNHPDTEHFCEDVFKVDPRDVVRGRPVGLAWFSPDCKDFSKAKGGKPKSKRVRGLAWVMVRWAETVRPRVMWLENVEEFVQWGPLLKTGFRCPLRKGRTFNHFVARLRNLGGSVEWKELRAADYGGAPTIRKRLYLCARFDGQPIVWPERTHGPADHPDVISGKLLPQRIAGDEIDFSIPCPSIFLTKEEAKRFGGKRPLKRPLASATMRRIARGIFKFVIFNPKPYIARVAHGEQSPGGVKRWGKGIHPTDEPLGTISGHGEFAVVAPHITKFRPGQIGTPCDAPLDTITAGGKPDRPGTGNAMGLVSARLAPIIVNTANGKFDGAPSRSRSPEEPLPAITGSPKYAIAAATLIQTGYGERKGQKPRVPGLQKPLGTCVNGQKHAVVAAFLAKHYGGNETPGAAFDEPADTITAKDHHAVVAVNMLTNTTGHSGGRADEPLKTIATGGHHGLVAAHIVRQFGESVGSDAAAPVGTVMSNGGGKTGLVTSHLAKFYGTATGQPMDRPLHTIAGNCGGGHFAEVRALLIKYYGEGGQDQPLDEPLHTISTRDRLGLVVVEGDVWAISDIGMRMLEPRELFNCQGFPRDYIIDIMVVDTWRSILTGRTVMKRLPKHSQVRLCGNSVPPPTVALLVGANTPELRMRDDKAA